MPTYVRIDLEFGRFLPEQETREVASADPAMVELPDGAISFRFFDRTEVETKDGETLRGEPRWHDATYYPGAKVETREEIEARADPRENILRETIRRNGWSGVLLTRFGRTLPYDPARCVILPTPDETGRAA